MLSLKQGMKLESIKQKQEHPHNRTTSLKELSYLLRKLTGEASGTKVKKRTKQK